MGHKINLSWMASYASINEIAFFTHTSAPVRPDPIRTNVLRSNVEDAINCAAEVFDLTVSLGIVCSLEQTVRAQMDSDCGKIISTQPMALCQSENWL